jgi:aminoglycoside phosphotransferase (APT) family kinase protein
MEDEGESSSMPESLTKRHVDAATLDALIADAFGADTGIVNCRELNDGFFNAAYRLQLTDGRDVVLKISPPQGAALLAYERDIMRAEVEFFREAATAGIPLPHLLHAGLDRAVIDGDYIVLSALDGVTWNSVSQDLDVSQSTALRRQLGSHIARLHRVRNPKGLFGYPALPELSAPTWPEAFTAMLDALIEDAHRFGVELPARDGQLREAVKRGTDDLAEISTPALVHFDLWPGNIMIDRSAAGGTPSITGLIDGERAIWGDPLMEFVGIDVFGRAERDPDLRAGYAADGGTVGEDGAAGRRLALYFLYMHLLLLIEVAPRGYTDAGYVGYVNEQCPQRIQAALSDLGQR